MGSKNRHKRRARTVRAQIVKAAPPAGATAASPNGEDGTSEGDGLHELTNMQLPFVSLVPAGANRMQDFLVIKQDAAAQKVVPAANADREAKQRAQEARSRQYGIEIKRVGSALSYPAGSPTTETLYGDPVNLAYPLGRTNNAVDVGRVRNALARFKQNYEQYTEERSRARVYERIVRRALASGVNVSFDANDPVDRLLPADLKQRLSKKTAEGAQAPGASAGEDQEPPSDQHKADFDAWCTAMEVQLRQRRLEATLHKRQAQAASAPPATPPASALHPTAPLHATVGPGAAPSPPPPPGNGAAADNALTQALTKAQQQGAEIARLRAEVARLRRPRVRVTAGSAIVAGDVLTPRPVAKHREDAFPDFPLDGTTDLSALVREHEQGDEQ